MKTPGQGETLPEVIMPSCPATKVLQGQKALVTGSSWGGGMAGL